MLDDATADKQDMNMTQTYVKHIEDHQPGGRFKFVSKPARTVKEDTTPSRKKKYATLSSTEMELKGLVEDEFAVDNPKVE